MTCDFCGKVWVTPIDVKTPAYPCLCDQCRSIPLDVRFPTKRERTNP